MVALYKGTLAVIINSFNRIDLLQKALPSIEETLLNTSIESLIIIYEAGSYDGSIEYIKNYSMQSKVEIVCVYPPIGSSNAFSYGCNYAINYASNKIKNLKWCFFYETDNCISNHDALSLALAFLNKQEKIAAVGFTVEKFNSTKAGFGQKFPTLLSFILGQQLSHSLGLLETKPKWSIENDIKWAYVDIVYTSPLLVNYEVWKQSQGMDTVNFPFSDSDNDWCWTVYKKGWKCAVIDVNGVIHDNCTVNSSWSSKRTIDFHRARFKLLRKHIGPAALIIKPLLILRHILELAILFFFFLLGKKGKENMNVRIILLQKSVSGYS